MKVLKTNINGGFPLTLDDFRWLLDGLKGAIAGGLSIGGHDTYVISGALDQLITGSTYGNTAGKVMIAGEVCDIDADTVGIDTASLPYRYIEPVVTFDAAGSKVFADSSVHDTYQLTKYKINGYATLQTGKIQWQLPYLDDIITEIVFKTGADAAITGGLVFLDPFANIYNINISPVDTLTTIIRLDPSTPVIWIKFVGANPTDTITIAPSSGIITPAGKTFVFKSGDWVQFVARDASIYELATLDQQAGSWTNMPSYSDGWVSYGGFQMRKNSDGLVTLRGSISNPSYGGGVTFPFAMPSGFAPTTPVNFAVFSHDGVFGRLKLQIGASFIELPSITAPTSVIVHLDGISYYTN